MNTDRTQYTVDVSLAAVYGNASRFDLAMLSVLRRFNVYVKVIGDRANRVDRRPLMVRWKLLEWRGRKLVLHQFVRGDNRELGIHDHPFVCVSLVVKGSYEELYVSEVISESAGFYETRVRSVGSLQRNEAEYRHVVTKINDCEEGSKGHCWTLAYLGKRERVWGFPDAGVVVG